MKKHIFNTQSKRLADGRYAYFPVEGEPVFLVPGVDVSEEVIIMLQEMDNEAARKDRTEDDHRFNLDHQKMQEVDNAYSQPTDPMEQVPDGTSDIFRQLFPADKPESKTLDVLAECILQLTAQQQDCIRDRFGMQLTIQEIADRDGVTIQAINNRLNKIYRRLKRLMAEHGIE